MGTIIKSVGINNSGCESGVVELVSKAAKLCLAKAELNVDDIGMLINTGIYSENHLIEPALAALVTKQLLTKSKGEQDYSNYPGHLLSFDLHNGGGGIINAIQVIDGFINSNEIENGLIVCGDVKPKAGMVENYNYSTAAAAIMLSKDKVKRGFAHFKSETFTEFIQDFSSSTNWENGSLRFENRQSSNYLESTMNCAESVLNCFLQEEHLSWGSIDMIITSQSPKGFTAGLQKRLKLKNKIVRIKSEDEIYSSGLLYSLNQVFESKQFRNARHILFVTVGAGITVSLAYYKNE